MAPAAAMIFAAGFGTRMGALTAERPKPLLEVAGRSLIDRALDMVAAAGIPRAVVNLHYRGGMIRDRLAARRAPGIRFSEEPEILETGGGLAAALGLLEADPVLTINPDGVWAGADPVRTLCAACRPEMEALLLLVPRASARAHAGAGDFLMEPDGRLSRRGARAAAPFVYTGAQIIRTGRLAAMPPGAWSLNRVWDAMIAEGGLYGVLHDGGWADVGTPAGLGAAEALLAGR